MIIQVATAQKNANYLIFTSLEIGFKFYLILLPLSQVRVFKIKACQITMSQ
jgi:hypothetical protein